jgi:parallel beta-helix repeat protein
VEKNDLDGGAGDGIAFEGTDNAVLDNDVEAYGDRGVLLDDGARNLIAGNDVEDCGDEGILIEADETRIEDNDISECGDDGLAVEADDVRIVDNDADDNGFATGKGYGIIARGEGIEGSGNDADGNANADCRPSRLCDNEASSGTSRRT